MSTADRLVGGLWTPKFYSQLPLHRNAGLELVLLERGSALWQVEGEDIAVEAGEMFYTFPWQEHGSAVPIDRAIRAWWVVIPLRKDGADWCFADQRLADLSLESLLSGDDLRQEQRPIVASEALRQYLPLLVRAQSADNGPWLTGHLAPLLIDAWISAVHNPLPRADAQPAVSSAIVAAWRHICRHHDQAWSLDAMADQAGLARTQFSAGIISLTGASPVKALNRERLAAACEDLLASDDDVADIAVRHGFNSAHYFSRQFRQYTRQSPSEFRQSGGSMAKGFGRGDNLWD